jgi:hypothetical protein
MHYFYRVLWVQVEKQQVMNELRGLQEAHGRELLAEQQRRQAIEAQLTLVTQQLGANNV